MNECIVSTGKNEFVIIHDTGVTKYLVKQAFLEQKNLDTNITLSYLLFNPIVQKSLSRTCTFYHGKNYTRHIFVTGLETSNGDSANSLIYEMDTNSWKKSSEQFFAAGRGLSVFTLSNEVYQILFPDIFEKRNSLEIFHLDKNQRFAAINGTVGDEDFQKIYHETVFENLATVNFYRRNFIRKN